MSDFSLKHLLQIALCVALTCRIWAKPSPLLGALIPKISQDGYELQPAANQYKLELLEPLGSRRSEVVQLESAGTHEEALSVNGTFQQFYPDTKAVFTITYEAGAQGYKVKYVYTTMKLDSKKITPGALKSAAG